MTIPRLHQRATLPLLALLYFLLAELGMGLLTLHRDNTALIWLPSGIGLLMLLQGGMRAAPLIMLASFAANYHGQSMVAGPAAIWTPAMGALSDCLGNMLSWYAFLHLCPRGLRRVQELPRFCFWVCVLPCAVSSLMLSRILAAGHFLDSSKYLEFAGLLMLSDSMGILCVYAIWQGWRDRPAGAPWQIANGAPFVLMLLAVILGATHLSGMVFFILPSLLMLGFRTDLFESMLVTTLTMILTMVTTPDSHSLFRGDSTIETDFRVIAFVFSGTLTMLGLALQQQQLKQTERDRSAWQDAAERDPLTGLLNRRALRPLLDNAHCRSRRTGLPYTVAMLDLDHFKQLNDRYGHAGGDAVLRHVAALLTTYCRTADSIGRIGGEEFMILLPDCAQDDALPVLDRIRQQLHRNPAIHEGRSIPVTASIGIAGSQADTDTPATLIEQADQALYRAKHQGRDRIVFAGRHTPPVP